MAGSIFRQAGQCSDGTDWCTKSHQSSASSETLLPARLLIDHAPSEGLDTGAQLYNMLWNNVTKWAEKLLFSVSVTHLISFERWCSHHRQILWKVQKKPNIEFMQTNKQDHCLCMQTLVKLALSLLLSKNDLKNSVVYFQETYKL